jgi:GINS complex subunit 2
LAEETLVDIQPTFRGPALRLLSGEFGPFIPNRLTRVPLWVAVSLRQTQRCRIAPPEWLDSDYLAEALRVENDRENDDKFSALPFHYLEVAAIILECGEVDVPNAATVRSILYDLQLKRSSKLRRSLNSLDAYVDGFDVSNLSAMEVNASRSLVCGSLNDLHRLSKLADPNARPSQSQTVSSQSIPGTDRDRGVGVEYGSSSFRDPSSHLDTGFEPSS